MFNRPTPNNFVRFKEYFYTQEDSAFQSSPSVFLGLDMLFLFEVIISLICISLIFEIGRRYEKQTIQMDGYHTSMLMLFSGIRTWLKKDTEVTHSDNGDDANIKKEASDSAVHYTDLRNDCRQWRTLYLNSCNNNGRRSLDMKLPAQKGFGQDLSLLRECEENLSVLHKSSGSSSDFTYLTSKPDFNSTEVCPPSSLSPNAVQVKLDNTKLLIASDEHLFSNKVTSRNRFELNYRQSSMVHRRKNFLLIARQRFIQRSWRAPIHIIRIIRMLLSEKLHTATEFNITGLEERSHNLAYDNTGKLDQVDSSVKSFKYKRAMFEMLAVENQKSGGKDKDSRISTHVSTCQGNFNVQGLTKRNKVVCHETSSNVTKISSNVTKLSLGDGSKNQFQSLRAMFEQSGSPLNNFNKCQSRGSCQYPKEANSHHEMKTWQKKPLHSSRVTILPSHSNMKMVAEKNPAVTLNSSQLDLEFKPTPIPAEHRAMLETHLNNKFGQRNIRLPKVVSQSVKEFGQNLAKTSQSNQTSKTNETDNIESNVFKTQNKLAAVDSPPQIVGQTIITSRQFPDMGKTAALNNNNNGEEGTQGSNVLETATQYKKTNGSTDKSKIEHHVNLMKKCQEPNIAGHQHSSVAAHPLQRPVEILVLPGIGSLPRKNVLCAMDKNAINLLEGHLRVKNSKSTLTAGLPTEDASPGVTPHCHHVTFFPLVSKEISAMGHSETTSIKKQTREKLEFHIEEKKHHQHSDILVSIDNSHKNHTINGNLSSMP